MPVQKLLAWIIGIGGIAAAVASGTWAYRASIPCREPRTLRIEATDPRFGIDDTHFATAADTAIALWNDATGRELLRRDPAGSIPVRTVFDKRQEAVQALKDLGLRLDQGEESYEQVKSEHNARQSAYDAAVQTYQADTAAFEKRKSTFEAEVAAAEANGVDREEFDRLEAERAGVNAAIPVFKQRFDALEKQRQDLNGLVTVLNRLAADHNDSVETYREVGDAIGNGYEAGLYVRENGAERIDVYAFSSQEELVSLLAHEFGHALGLGHVEDSSAVMYRLNESGRDALAPSDVAAIRARCRIAE